MHNRKLLKTRREKDTIENHDKSLFFKDYQIEMMERISFINENFKNCMFYGFRGKKLETPKNIEKLIYGNLGKTNKTELIYDEELLPFGESSLDMILSFFNLHFANDIPGILYQTLSSLKPNGIFIGCLFCGDTLKELNYSFLKAEEEICGGASPRVSPFIKLQDLASLLQTINFSLPVADIDRHNIYYNHPEDLLKELKIMGETNILTKMNKSTLRKDVLEKMYEIYIDKFSNKEGKINATFEIAWITGWKYHESQQKPLEPGSGKFAMIDSVRSFEEEN